MGKIVKPLPVKLIIGLIAKDPVFFQEAKTILQKKLAKVDNASPVFLFNQTDYYEKEMGQSLKRIFLSFQRLIPAEQLVRVKLGTNALEKRLSLRTGQRLINIDPGYITLSKLVLATTKSFVHRLYIAQGIHEEITLYFKGNTFVAGPWTYPDYQTPSHIVFFNEVRNIYYQQIEKQYGPAQIYRSV